MRKKYFIISLISLALFVIWTILLCFVDKQPIGPLDSTIGFATVNKFIHNLTSTNMMLYVITDWLSLIPMFCVFIFAFIGLIQWMKRKTILKIDFDILILGLFYITVFTLYFLFEKFVINYRPILINRILEASYPSSTTLLVLCVMPTTVMQ